MNVGSEWLIDASGCRAERLAERAVMVRLCGAVVADLELKIVGAPVWHQFPPPGGVTGLYLLSESHLTCHTFPEHGLATFNLYCCRDRARWPWEDRLADLLGAERVSVRRLSRGGRREGEAPAEPQQPIRAGSPLRLGGSLALPAPSQQEGP